MQRERWITAEGSARGTQCLPMGDLVYVPQCDAPQEQFEAACEALRHKEWLFRIIPEKFHAFMRNADLPLWAMDALLQSYVDYRERYQREPGWAKKLDPLLIAYFRRRYMLTDGTDPFALMPTLPFSGIGYAVKEGGLCERTTRTFGLWRLANIKQLGFLTDPVVQSSDIQGAGMTFHHTRYGHSLDVMAVATLMLSNNQISPILRNTLRIAALSHDALTPAGGDTTKLVDRDAFDEDKNFPELLARTDWSELHRRYGVLAATLVDTIQGRGLLGHMLDIADKVAYVARDAAIYLGRYAPDGPHAYPVGYYEIKTLVEKNRYVCGIWDAVRVIGKDVVIEDAGRLGEFLKLRALLFRELYYHPGSRFLEHMAAKVIVQYLYDTGALTRDQLLLMTDLELEHIISGVVGQPYYMSSIGLHGDPRVEVFKSPEDAYVRERELIHEGVVLTLVDVFTGATNGGLYLSVKKEGKILSFREAHPHEAAEIENILRPQHPARLYYMPAGGDDFSEEFLAALASHRQKTLAAQLISSK